MAQSYSTQEVNNFNRCINCNYRKPVTKGRIIHQCCFHEPYKGTRVAEINECPKDLSQLPGQMNISDFIN